MSSIMEQAVLDAKQIQEAAKNSAEAEVLEKYQGEIKEKMDEILAVEKQDVLNEAPQDPVEQEPDNQDDLDMDDELDFGDDGLDAEGVKDDGDVADQAPMAATDGEDLCPCPEDDEEVEIDFDQLAQELEMGEGEAEKEDHDEVEDDVVNDTEGMLEEELDVDIEQPTSGWARSFGDGGADMELDVSDEELEDELDKFFGKDETAPKNDRKVKSSEDDFEDSESSDMPDAQLDEVKQKVKQKEERIQNLESQISDLQETVDKMRQKKENLKESRKQYKSKLLSTNKKLKNVNTSRARLFYKNRVYESQALNARQKSKLVEALEDTDSVKEMKVVYNNLKGVIQNGVGSNKSNAANGQQDNTINEALSKSDKASLVANKSNDNPQNRRSRAQQQNRERMQKLAGINKNRGD